ncbi:hypothetical protein EJ02DRAFT_450032 [Clathrospora elynae]|uniref:MATH and UCH domain-containing protein n=1 Tax=Clathrospora elynae TaxID=706981 RepID=A0A6A5T8I0_9PLEO|nr:hypothetical protein EJ02DRAFT_450032 [Clathrospora elynae]
MSVSMEQPLHFSQQVQPLSPSFDSPPQSPNHLLHAQTPAPPLSLAADVDMSSSTTLGQSHDRDDAEMRDGEGEGEGTTTAPAPTRSNREASTQTVAVEITAVDEDAMDTTLDDTELLQIGEDIHGTPHAQAASIITPTPPGAAMDELGDEHPAVPIDDAVPPSLADPNAQPPPPPPQVEPVRSDSDSDSEDEGAQPWHPLPEDTSSPDEDELREIEEMTEHSALEHEYWESKTFLPLEEPEYTAGPTGRIDWAIEDWNGTREKPNHETLRKSDVVTIGGHQWQIKFYPKGNDTDHLSIYLECLSVMDGHNEAPITPTEPQHAPLPLLGSKTLPKRNCVAAQVSVVLYNPTEPRVNYSKTDLHRFCGGMPDWGWTRFHGPYYEICHRMRGQRMALLRDDKLSFTAYIRVVEDETHCLGEHPTNTNPWDSFAMTGLQGLMLGEVASAPGGNMISAVASWMLFNPFRTLLYSIRVADPEEEPFVRPKPLVSALQKVLYMLRTQVDPGAGAVALDDVLDALEWYGIHERLDKLDVIETWEVLRLKLEEELHDTPHAATLQDICGPKRNYSSGVPSYRVPVIGVETMQEAVNKSANTFTVPGKPLPELLTIELERQDFDLKTRSYVKVLNKVSLDDRIIVGDTPYTLYGFVVHKQTLQSYVYQPILRPEGPGSRWYGYSDSKGENQVKCLTKRQAVDAHEGTPSTEQVVGNDAVAYIAMYVRDDVAPSAFVSDAESEQWDVPAWIKDEVERSKASSLLSPLPIDELVSDTVKAEKPEVEAEPSRSLEFQVIDARVFSDHEGPGLFDAFDPRSETGLIHTIKLSGKDGCKAIREKLIGVLEGIKDPRQVTFWFLDALRGSFGRPNLLSTGKMEFSSGSYDRYTDSREWTLEEVPFACRRIWVYVRDFDKLPELPKEVEKNEAILDGPAVPTTNEDIQASISAEETDDIQASIPADGIQVDAQDVDALVSGNTPDLPLQSEDTPMSEPDGSIVAQLEQPEQLESHMLDAEIPPPTNITEDDTAMIEVEPAVDPPGVDVVNTSTAAPGDTEMGGTQENLPPPPPPAVDIFTELLQAPRTPTPEPPADEIYFFLKFWNPEKQALESRGTHIALKNARVDETVVALLGLQMEDKKKVEMWEEEELSTARPIKHRRTFAQVDLHNTTIIIAALPIITEQRNALAARAAFGDVQAYLVHRSFARNFPHKLYGYFTQSYFSGEYYKGEIASGHRHGQGIWIYYSGDTYNGSFRLGARHGHGLYTFQNGNTYDGDWVDNQQHGSGTFVQAASGNTYVGGWKNDKKFGEGVTHWKHAEESERLCRICWDSDAEAAFYDCGHVVACLPCAREVQSCPVCRKRVLSAMKLYHVA